MRWALRLARSLDERADAAEHLVSKLLAEPRVGRVTPADAAVQETIAAFLKHRPLHIPGRLMRIMTRLSPRSLSVKMNGRLLGQAARTLAHRKNTAPTG